MSGQVLALSPNMVPVIPGYPVSVYRMVKRLLLVYHTLASWRLRPVGSDFTQGSEAFRSATAPRDGRKPPQIKGQHARSGSGIDTLYQRHQEGSEQMGKTEGFVTCSDSCCCSYNFCMSVEVRTYPLLRRRVYARRYIDNNPQ
jgi:hypothetical protein